MPTAQIKVVIDETGHAEIAHPDGPRTLDADTADTAREQVMELLGDLAQERGEALRVLAADPQGSWPLLVHPDGQITADDQPAAEDIATSLQEPAPAAAVELSPAPSVVEPEPDPEPVVTEPAIAVGVWTREAATRTSPVMASTELAVSEPQGPPVLAGAASVDLPTVAEPTARAEWGLRGKVARATGLHIPATEQERDYLAHVAAIRQATWARSVNIAVVGEKGGVGKTPTTLVLAGILGLNRGGFVAAVEISLSPGTLPTRSEGTPRVGVWELITNLDEITSVGQLGGYTLPQSSKVDVIASPAMRPELRAQEVYGLRRVLDRYYKMTVVDTDNHPGGAPWRAAVLTADAIVVPVPVSVDGLKSATNTIEYVRQYTRATTGVHQRVTAVITHNGAPEPKGYLEKIREVLAPLCTVVEVPHDPEIGRGGPITVSRLSHESLIAWTRVAATVVEHLQDAPMAPLI